MLDHFCGLQFFALFVYLTNSVNKIPLSSLYNFLMVYFFDIDSSFSISFFFICKRVKVPLRPSLVNTFIMTSTVAACHHQVPASIASLNQIHLFPSLNHVNKNHKTLSFCYRLNEYKRKLHKDMGGSK